MKQPTGWEIKKKKKRVSKKYQYSKFISFSLRRASEQEKESDDLMVLLSVE
jgi:hypothetical protein